MQSPQISFSFHVLTKDLNTLSNFNNFGVILNMKYCGNSSLKIMVIGSAGFIGKHLTARLKSLGANLL